MNGEERIMKGTLNPDILNADSKYSVPVNESIHSVNDNIVTCWDTEKSGWRCFKIDSLNIDVIYK